MSILFDKIRKILYIKFSFHYDQIQLKTKLELELGMDSRELLEFFSELEKTFKIKISFDDIDNLIEENKILTIQTIVDYIEIRLKFSK
jgi:acyl carrier protein